MRVSLKFSMIVIILAAAAAIAFTGCKSGGSQAAALGTEKPLPNAPDVTFKDLQGKDVSIASLKGKVVVVNFWATWCEPCQVEIPWMIGFQKKYADKGFTLLGVAMDEEGKSVVEPYVQKTQFDVDGHPTTMNYPIVLGNDDLAGQIRRPARPAHHLRNHPRRQSRQALHRPRHRKRPRQTDPVVALAARRAPSLLPLAKLR